MRARWGAALAAASLAASARAEAADGSCELARVDRAKATARACMSCHDGSAGPLVELERSPDGHGTSHPVEVDYATAAASHPDQYQPVAGIPAEIPLVRGKVECTSCHDPAAPGPGHVAKVRDLCLACHRL